jgi:hypothetical protein
MKKKGFKGPYKKWGDYDYDLLNWHQDKYDVPQTEVGYYLLE